MASAIVNNNMQQMLTQSFLTRSPLSQINESPPDSPTKHRISDLLEPLPSRVTPQQTTPSPSLPNNVPPQQGKRLEEEEREEWPELQAIIRKIGRLEGRLKEERRLRREAEENASTSIKRASEEQAKRTQLQAQLESGQLMRNELQARIDQLQVLLSQKEALLLEKQQILQELQFTQIKRKNEHEEKIRKAGLESKELTDRLRKANLTNSKILKESMQKQIAQMQSQREEYLVCELDRVKGLLALSEEERQTKLLSDVNALNRKVYKLEEMLKRKEIELSLMERKKQQAINDAVQRKDAEIKVQKSLFKSLTEKYAKLQEQLKVARVSDCKGRQSRIDRDEQVSFELSPEKM